MATSLPRKALPSRRHSMLVRATIHLLTLVSNSVRWSHGEREDPDNPAPWVRYRSAIPDQRRDVRVELLTGQRQSTAPEASNCKACIHASALDVRSALHHDLLRTRSSFGLSDVEHPENRSIASTARPRRRSLHRRDAPETCRRMFPCVPDTGHVDRTDEPNRKTACDFAVPTRPARD